MGWKDVGDWLRANAGPGAALVGTLVGGPVGSAIALGASLISSATGESDPEKALSVLQRDNGTVVRLKELALQNDEAIRAHLRATMEAELKDRQAEHEQTQLTIRGGDASSDKVVARTRPLQSWAGLVGAFAYVIYQLARNGDPSVEIAALFMSLPWAYFGLRQVGKWKDVGAQAQVLVEHARTRRDGT